MTLERAVGAAIRGVGVFAIVFGFVIVLGGSGRMSSPAFAAIRGVAEMVDVDPSHLWGISLAASGLLVIMPRTELAGLYLVVLWCTLFAIGAAVAAVSDPVASVTGPPIYSFTAVMVAGLIAVRWSGLAPKVKR